MVFADSHRAMVDGTLIEAKALIAGFWLWQVKSMAEMIEWAKRCSKPFDGELEIEIRQMFEAENFGDEFMPELSEQEARLRAQMMSKG